MPARSNIPVLFLLITSLLTAQQSRKAVAIATGERVFAVVPLTGAGTFADPIRPLFAPKPGDQPGPGGRLSYTMTLSDDGKSAIVEFSAPDRKAFAEILNSRRPDVKAFERGKATKEEIENEFRKVKKDFDVNTLVRGGK